MTGVCKFCKQGALIHNDYLERWPEWTLDEIATKVCSCEEAKKQNIRDDAYSAINTMFSGENDDNTRILLVGVVDAICDEAIESSSFKAAGGIKISVKLTSKGKIRIDKTITMNEAKEI